MTISGDWSGQYLQKYQQAASYLADLLNARDCNLEKLSNCNESQSGNISCCCSQPLQCQRLFRLYQHASQCPNLEQCNVPGCTTSKRLLDHLNNCQNHQVGNCLLCALVHGKMSKSDEKTNNDNSMETNNDLQTCQSTITNSSQCSLYPKTPSSIAKVNSAISPVDGNLNRFSFMKATNTGNPADNGVYMSNSDSDSVSSSFDESKTRPFTSFIKISNNRIISNNSTDSQEMDQSDDLSVATDGSGSSMSLSSSVGSSSSSLKREGCSMESLLFPGISKRMRSQSDMGMVPTSISSYLPTPVQSQKLSVILENMNKSGNSPANRSKNRTLSCDIFAYEKIKGSGNGRGGLL